MPQGAIVLGSLLSMAAKVEEAYTCPCEYPLEPCVHFMVPNVIETIAQGDLMSREGIFCLFLPYS